MSKNWMDPQEIARNSRVLGAFTVALCGVATWDVLTTLHFDISIMRGKRPWRWPMVLYFICRICMLLHIYAFAVNLNAISEIPCQEVTWISKVTDAIGTCGSSLILVLRTRAVWHRNWKVTVPLLLMFAGQIAVWCQTFRYSQAAWSAERRVCQVLSTAPKPMLITVFAYTMAFDLIILIVCAWRLSKGLTGSGLGKLLLRDGIAYFCAVFGANLAQMIFASLGYNPVMNLMCLPFALVVSVIASTTIFRNVFVAYDSFASNSTRDQTGASRGYTEPFANSRNLGRFAVSHGDKSHTASDIPLGTYGGPTRTNDIPIAVHKFVDINVDVDSHHENNHAKSQGGHTSSKSSYVEKPLAL